MNFSPEMFEGTVWQYTYVGSRVTCVPPPADTDQDVLVLVLRDKGEEFLMQMAKHGFDVELGEGYAEDALNAGEDNRFQSYRLGDTNLIATLDYSFYRNFLAATSVAKRLNILDKGDRISLFQAVLYGNKDGSVTLDEHEAKDPFGLEELLR